MDLVTLGPAEVTVVQDVRVFPALGDVVWEHQDVTLAGGTIVEIAPTGGPVPEGSRLIPGAGHTLLPGYIDAHVHVLGDGAAPGIPGVDVAYNLSAWLSAGVTTVYDMGDPARTLQKLASGLDSGAVVGPRLRYGTLPITATGGHPLALMQATTRWPVRSVLPWVIPQVDRPEDADRIVEQQLQYGARFVKIVVDDLPPGGPILDTATVSALVVAGHQQKVPVVAHAGSAASARRVIEAGADILAHGVYRDVIPDADLALYQDLPVIWTWLPFEAAADIVEGRWAPSAWDERLMPPSLWSPIVGDLGPARIGTGELFATASVIAQGRSAWASNLQKVHGAGAQILVGTDSAQMGVYAGSGWHREVRALAAAGIPNVDILLGATSRAARLFDANPDFGTIEEGKVADLVLVEGDPLRDISACGDIVRVFRAGREVRTGP